MKLTNKTVPISALRLSKHNWKRDISEEDVADLAENIEEVGSLNPITVRPVGKAGTMYEILAGVRRWRALRLLGTKKVEVRVARCDDIQAEIISYSENLKVKKPNSKEWAEGVKRLVDLFEKKRKVGTRTRSALLKKPRTSDTTEFSVAATENSGPGRPKKDRTQAIKDTAKSIGASEQTVRRAVRREEELIPTAARSLKLGKITQEQADILAALPKKAQQRQFPDMVKETREETRRRRSVEKIQDREDRDHVIIDMLASIFLDCKELGQKLDIAAGAMSGTKLDHKQLIKLPNYSYVLKVRNSLSDILKAINKQAG
jgi:ParB-like chromosome segregation protein Spo0J